MGSSLVYLSEAFLIIASDVFLVGYKGNCFLFRSKGLDVGKLRISCYRSTLLYNLTCERIPICTLDRELVLMPWASRNFGFGIHGGPTLPTL